MTLLGLTFFLQNIAIQDTAEGCIDKDHGVFDRYGDNCTWYTDTKNGLTGFRLSDNCGLYDDDDFVADIMCCACKGFDTILIN